MLGDGCQLVGGVFTKEVGTSGIQLGMNFGAEIVVEDSDPDAVPSRKLLSGADTVNRKVGGAGVGVFEDDSEWDVGGFASPDQRQPKNGQNDSRGTEIQRLIGRVLRAVIDFKKLGANTIHLDCDVLQADGGTRTAAINGSFIALTDAITYGMKNGLIAENPLKGSVAAVSVGLIKAKAVLDLDYELDSNADVDLNIAMTDQGHFVELQGTGEQTTFSPEQLQKMINLARIGINKIFAEQKKCLKIK